MWSAFEPYRCSRRRTRTTRSRRMVELSRSVDNLTSENRREERLISEQAGARCLPHAPQQLSRAPQLSRDARAAARTMNADLPTDRRASAAGGRRAPLPRAPRAAARGEVQPAAPGAPSALVVRSLLPAAPLAPMRRSDLHPDRCTCSLSLMRPLRLPSFAQAAHRSDRMVLHHATQHLQLVSCSCDHVEQPHSSSLCLSADRSIDKHFAYRTL